MPFSLKKFALPRSTSMPAGNKQHPPQPPPKDPKAKLPVSRSAAELPAAPVLKQPDIIQTDRQQREFLPPPLGIMPDGIQVSTLPVRWRGADSRRMVVKKNGVRFQGGGPPDNSPGNVSFNKSHGNLRLSQWNEDDAKGSTQSLKRPPSRRQHPQAHSTCSLLRPSMDLESRLYQPPSSIYDDDPGIMSEAETSATGFRRAAKIRSSLPIVRTPSKTQERPMGMVFLQYLNETKRALLPNEITSMDTVKALFVRSFPKQLSMEHMDSGHVHVYIHDPAKDMFYELEDLRDVKDRSVLRIYEQDINGGGVYSTYEQDTSYFSEPEFDSDYQHQHIHRTKGSKSVGPTQSAYYGTVLPPYNVRSQTLPHNTSLRSAYTPEPGKVSGQAPPKPQRSFQQTMGPMSKGGMRSGSAGPPALPPSHPSERRHEPSYRSLADRPLPERPYSALGQHPGYNSIDRYDHSYHPSERRVHESGYASSPEHRADNHRPYSSYGISSYDDSYYGLYGSRSESTTPIIDEEARVRMEYMERQLASLTGLVQKALTVPRHLPSATKNADPSKVSGEHAREAPQGKQTIFEEERNRPPVKPEFRLSPELYFYLRQLRKQTKDIRQDIRNLRRFAQSQAITARETVRDTSTKIKTMLATARLAEDQSQSDRTRVSREEELYKQDTAHLEKDLSELESHVEELRSNVINRRCRVNMNDVESMALVLSRASKSVADLKARYPSLQETLKTVMTSEMEVVIKEEKFLKEEPEKLETALRRCKKLTGTLVTLKRLASVQEQRSSQPAPTSDKTSSGDAQSDSESSTTKSVESSPHTVIHVPPDGHQKPSRAENALDALLDELQTFNKPPETTKRDVIPGLLGSQRRLPSYPSGDSPVRTPTHTFSSPSPTPKAAGSAFLPVSGKVQVADGGNKTNSTSSSSNSSPVPPEKPELFVRVSVSGGEVKAEMSNVSNVSTKKTPPPPPPPRTTSKSPVSSPTNSHASFNFGQLRSNSEPSNPTKHPLSVRLATKEDDPKDPSLLTPPTNEEGRRDQLSSNSSSSESVNSQEGLQVALQQGINKLERKIAATITSAAESAAEARNNSNAGSSRQEMLEHRHQELLRKQKQLQEQYARLQQLQRGQLLQRFSPPRMGGLIGDLKKTGSESNILSKTSLVMSTASGSLTHLAAMGPKTVATSTSKALSTGSTTTKIFETDIL